MHYVFVRQIVCFCYDCLSGFNWRQAFAFFIKFRPGSTVCGAGNASSRPQLGVGCIYHGINAGLVCDVALQALDVGVGHGNYVL